MSYKKLFDSSPIDYYSQWMIASRTLVSLSKMSA
jgi:hypothetical protein